MSDVQDKTRTRRPNPNAALRAFVGDITTKTRASHAELAILTDQKKLDSLAEACRGRRKHNKEWAIETVRILGFWYPRIYRDHRNSLTEWIEGFEERSAKHRVSPKREAANAFDDFLFKLEELANAPSIEIAQKIGLDHRVLNRRRLGKAGTLHKTAQTMLIQIKRAYRTLDGFSEVWKRSEPLLKAWLKTLDTEKELSVRYSQREL